MTKVHLQDKYSTLAAKTAYQRSCSNTLVNLGIYETGLLLKALGNKDLEFSHQHEGLKTKLQAHQLRLLD